MFLSAPCAMYIQIVIQFYYYNKTYKNMCPQMFEGLTQFKKEVYLNFEPPH